MLSSTFLDEVGYLPIDQRGADLLFQVKAVTLKIQNYVSFDVAMRVQYQLCRGIWANRSPRTTELSTNRVVS